MQHHTQRETRFAVVDALDELMQTQSIDRIKVTDLCRRAQISRATFYDYFENIYGVATWCWDQVLADSLYRLGDERDFHGAHVQLCQNLLARRTFFKRAFRSVDYNSVYQYGTRTMAEYYFQNVPKLLGRALTEQEQLEIALYNAGAAWLTSEWAKDGMREPPELMARAYTAAAPAVMGCLMRGPG